MAGFSASMTVIVGQRLALVLVCLSFVVSRLVLVLLLSQQRPMHVASNANDAKLLLILLHLRTKFSNFFVLIIFVHHKHGSKNKKRKIVSMTHVANN